MANSTWQLSLPDVGHSPLTSPRSPVSRDKNFDANNQQERTFPDPNSLVNRISTAPLPNKLSSANAATNVGLTTCVSTSRFGSSSAYVTMKVVPEIGSVRLNFGIVHCSGLHVVDPIIGWPKEIAENNLSARCDSRDSANCILLGSPQWNSEPLAYFVWQHRVSHFASRHCPNPLAQWSCQILLPAMIVDG
jgi:hypothetical protein